MSKYHLETRYNGAAANDEAKISFALTNLSKAPLTGARILISLITRISDEAQVFGADFVARMANTHEFDMPDGLSVAPGMTWAFGFTGVDLRPPHHACDGPASAYLTLADDIIPVTVSDISHEGTSLSGLRDLPKGTVSEPLALLPWPAVLDIASYGAGCAIGAAMGASIEDRAALAGVAALQARLFPNAKTFLRLDDAPATLTFEAAGQKAEGFELVFEGGNVTLRSSDPAGRFYGLVALAQMAQGAFENPDDFQFPTKGIISDAPRFGYRGGHLDVSRHFWDLKDVTRFLDMMAWSRMNVFQWHLTDDEGWRVEIDAYPELTEIGAWRGPNEALPGQYAYADTRYGGYYTKQDLRAAVDHAADLHIGIVPEVDIPGHCGAVLASLPDLIDPNEDPEYYRSVQGYTNNCLNPGLSQTYEFVEKVLAEIAEIFPAKWIHVGADEVPEGAWLRSPAAQILAQREGVSGTAEIQSYFLRRVQTILRANGKELAGWDEVSHGGGVDQEGTLLVAWQKPDVVPALAAQGYTVIASPGQAYYLDMVQAEGWEEPGASWAGTVPCEQSYAFDPEGDLPEAERGALAGVQACIWCEHIWTQDRFNHLVWPRLYAVAEAGWTPQNARDWSRFSAQVWQMPKL